MNVICPHCNTEIQLLPGSHAIYEEGHEYWCGCNHCSEGFRVIYLNGEFKVGGVDIDTETNLHNPIPTEEEYRKAKDNITMILEWKQIGTDRLLALIDQVTKEKELLDSCEQTLIHNKKIVMTYEIYKELEEKRSCTKQ